MDSSAVAGLPIAGLSALWRKSLAALSSPASPAAKAQVVAVRALLLDELERREPEVLAAWLAAGAVEPGGPSAYLVR